ncbi:hypothetical protein [Acinetobacter indicus]|uniref:hypothetical protein n=1 Tax=Acinetobacter indicus TaxID=756892 RepID=UPI002575CC43|nr:hypothetical protein [Acinetobacter indicus]
MNKILLSLTGLALMIWLWSEYFRAIPHLQQSGVLKNFALETEGDFSGQYQVVAKRYYSPDRRVIHPAAPVVGHFNDLAYVSNIDLLLAKEDFSASGQAQTVDFEQTLRCYQFQRASTSPLAAQQVIANTLNISAIAASEQIAQRLRRVKAGQRIVLRGEWVKVRSVSTGQYFQISHHPIPANNCRIVRVQQLQVLD